MEKILFVVRSFSKHGPQPLRFQMITSIIKSEFEIHVLEIHHEKEKSVFENGIWLHKIRYSLLGRILNARDSRKIVSESIKVNPLAIKISLLKKLIRKLFFPDILILEKSRLIKKMHELMHKYKFSSVVASGFPFTTMVLSKQVKKKYQGVGFIYDVGDPFYNNSQNGNLKDYLAKIFEKKYLKYIDKLIVTNNITRKHYLECYEGIIRPDQLEIIQMGISFNVLDSPGKKLQSDLNSTNTESELVFVYAGQFYIKLREPFELYKAISKWNLSHWTRRIKLSIYGSISNIFKIKSNNSANIHFQGQISNDKVIEEYLNCSGIVFIDNAWGLQTPGKIFEVAAIGKPVLFISNYENSPAYEVVKAFKHFYFCKNNCDSILGAIEKIDFESENISVQEIRSNFTWTKRAKQYSELLKTLICKC